MSEIKPTNGQLTVIDAEGNEKLCQILFTLKSEEFGKNYVVFYPIESIEDEESEQIQLMAASYVENEDGTGELSEVETDEEWALLENAVAEYEEHMGDDEEDGCCCHHHCDDDEEGCCHGGKGHCDDDEEGCCCHGGKGHCEEDGEGCEERKHCCHHEE